MEKSLHDLLGYQSIRICLDHRDDLKEVMEKDLLGRPRANNHLCDMSLATDVFMMGYLAGIRAERKRKKTKVTSWKLCSDLRKLDPEKGRC